MQAEQEEEAIANRLMKRLDVLKHEKEELARQVEVEEEMITNALTKKLMKVKEEKVNLEIQLEQEQEVRWILPLPTPFFPCMIVHDLDPGSLLRKLSDPAPPLATP